LRFSILEKISRKLSGGFFFLGGDPSAVVVR